MLKNGGWTTCGVGQREDTWDEENKPRIGNRATIAVSVGPRTGHRDSDGIWWNANGGTDLPHTVKEYYFRGDTAAHEHTLVEWLLHPEREGGPKGFIGYAISARMSPQLKAAVEKIAEENWEPCPSGSEDVIRECAEVDFVQWMPTERRDSRAVRYIALRLRKKQGELFVDGSSIQYFAVATNVFDWKMQRLIQWHREKAGTIEHIHDILKNELAAGIMPCGRFGANAAWLRMAVLTHNVLTALKRIGMSR